MIRNHLSPELVGSLHPDADWISFRSILATLVVSAEVRGETLTHLLEDSESWTPGEGDVVTAGDGGWHLLPLLQDPIVISRPAIIQPFNGNGAPNPALWMVRSSRK
jgi:hypothetical protein